MAQRLEKFVLLAATSLSIGVAGPAYAQTASGSDEVSSDSDEIVVTARRRTELLQDVPISITVFNQEQLDNRNITNATDLSTYTPSLSSNPQFGSDNASFAIRGFTQTLRTTASVGVYFAEVVAQRGGQNSTTVGDGAGPGSFFDLENVQVLKGPQGTLFGRNTTGGAIMLTPKKPTDRFEGYVEGSYGNFDMYRVQGVVNLPIGENVRLRLGVDHQKRDGYLRVIDGLGVTGGKLGELDYIAGRASLVIDLTDNLENYTIATLTRSRGTANIQQLFACNPATFANTLTQLLKEACVEQLTRNDYGFYDVGSHVTNPISRLNQWQVINTTTLRAHDRLTIKNIFSYGETNQRLRSALFGGALRVPANYPAAAGLPFIQNNVNPNDGGKMTDQRNLVEEIQLSGDSGDGKLVWQAGMYYERSSPKSFVGNRADSNIRCVSPGDETTDPAQMLCQDVLRLALGGATPRGSVVISRINLAYTNIAAYGQATYKFSDLFSITAGIRYTWDETRSKVQQTSYAGFPTAAPGTPNPVFTRCVKTTTTLALNCTNFFHQFSEAPTWLVDFDFHPNRDILLYAKYARGYRQGAIVPVGADNFEAYGPESVDTYELGAKFSFRGAVRGFLNVAAFYNDLKDQQIQVGVACIPIPGVWPPPSVTCPNPTTFIANAGKSTLKGIEVEGRISPTEWVSFDLGYAYLKTKVKQVATFAPPLGVYNIVVPSVSEGTPAPFTPKHKLSLGVTFNVPAPEGLGKVSIGGNYTYTSKTFVTIVGPFGTLPSFEIVNLNASWDSIGGSPIDASFFVTNLFNEKYATFVPGFWTNFGEEFRHVGLPRMFGGRLRYTLGK